MDLKTVIRSIPDYPKPGIIFRDVTTLLADARGFGYAVDQMVAFAREHKVDRIVGIEARGFIVGGAVAHSLGLGFDTIRKEGKLPLETIGESYELEYGTDRIEIHTDMLNSGDRVLVVDDLVATGGTAIAGINLVKRTGAEVAAASFIIDLPELGGSTKIRDDGIAVQTLVEYEGL